MRKHSLCHVFLYTKLILSSYNPFHFSNYQPQLNLEQTHTAGEDEKRALTSDKHCESPLFFFNTEP